MIEVFFTIVFLIIAVILLIVGISIRYGESDSEMSDRINRQIIENRINRMK